MHDRERDDDVTAALGPISPAASPAVRAPVNASPTLPFALAERLREMIIEGELAPGARLNERALCERLGVSRTPLREAFRVLAAEGLVDLQPNRGAQVVALSDDDIRDSFEVMGALEALSGELACRAHQRRRGRGDQGAHVRDARLSRAARPARVLPPESRDPRSHQRGGAATRCCGRRT